MLPFFDVSHLPSSASFYSAVLQPLGLFYIRVARAGDSAAFPSDASAVGDPVYLPSSVTFGTLSPLTPVFQIREVTHPKQSSVTFTAPSPTTAVSCRALAIRANPAGLFFGKPLPSLTPDGDGAQTPCISGTRITDFDGNAMNVTYLPSSKPHHSSAGSDVRETQSSPEEASRILNWNYDVAASDQASELAPVHLRPVSEVRSVALSRGSSRPQAAPRSQLSRQPPQHAEPCSVLRRSVTTSAIHQPTGEISNDGSNTTGIVGAFLGAAAGVAAGAALTYGMMKGDRESAHRQELVTAPQIQRRGTYPCQPCHSHPHDGRYVEIERTVEKIRYPDNYAPLADSRRPPQYLAKYSRADVSSARAVSNAPAGGRGRTAARQPGQGDGSTARSRSEAPSPIAPSAPPLMIANHEHRSKAGSQASTARPPTVRAPSIRGHPELESSREADRDASSPTRSTRSKRSSSTTRRPRPPTVETELAGRSRAPSKASSRSLSKPPSSAPSKRASSRGPSVRESSAVEIKDPSVQGPNKTWSKASSKTASKAAYSGIKYSVPPNASRTPSHISARNIALPMSEVSARNIALPMSNVGSSHAAWDDDVASLAPSDSISCIGSKASRRRRA